MCEGKMLHNLGLTELLVIFGIAFLLFGNRLPKVGRSLGESIRDFKKAMNEEPEKDSKPQEDLRTNEPRSDSRLSPGTRANETKTADIIDVHPEEK